MIRIALALVCAACGGTTKRPTTAVADAVVGKQTFVVGVRGGAPTIERWSGKGKVVLMGDITGDGLGDAIALDEAVHVLVGRPPHALGSAVAVAGKEDHAVLLDAVAVGDLDGDGANEIVVHGSVVDPPGSVNAVLRDEPFLAVIRGGARSLGQPLERIASPDIRALLPSVDVDGDRRSDLLTYQCDTECTVSVWHTMNAKLGPQTPIATWPTAQRIVTGIARPSGYVIVAVEPQTIRSYTLERESLRQLAPIAYASKDDALLGPVAIGDFDHDGRMDVAVVSGRNKVLVWSNGRLAPPLALASPERVRTLALVDLDRDGDDDLLVATDDLVSLYRGSPTGLEASPSWKTSLR